MGNVQFLILQTIQTLYHIFTTYDVMKLLQKLISLFLVLMIYLLFINPQFSLNRVKWIHIGHGTLMIYLILFCYTY